MQREYGFTLIELILVIVVLGTLSAIALPRFVNLSDDAHIATANAEAAAFKDSINLVHSTYLLRKTNPVVVAGATVTIDTTTEWPTGTGSGGQLCINLWNSLLANAEPITAVSSPTSTLATGWNTFGITQLCAYGKKFGDLTFSSGNLPHFIYYKQDVGSFTYFGQTYSGKAGDVQKINL